MRALPLLFLLFSCAQNAITERPLWVDAIRKGEESLKVTNGSKVYYRRIAGSSDVSRQTSCNLVIMKAEEDLRKEYPFEDKIPYNVEVLYYDPDHKDCAVTISVSKIAPTEGRKVAAEEIQKIDEASALVLNRSELATKFALTGLTKTEFEKFVNDKVTILQGHDLCGGAFKTDTYSIHGLTHVCWRGDIIAGYCTSKERQCWTRMP